MQVVAHYIGHSGWLLEVGDQLLLFDYYKGDIPPVIDDIGRELLIFVSHSHSDHFNRKTVYRLATERANTTIILADEVSLHLPSEESIPATIVRLEEGGKYVHGSLTVKAFGSTDAGVSFLLSYPQVSFFHAGDYNLWHWPLESTPQEIKTAEEGFYRILETLKGKSINIALFPVDSRQQGDYDRGAREFAHTMRPEVFLPMHFGSDHNDLQQFFSWAEQTLPHMKVCLPEAGNEIVINTQNERE